jgi:hypothetical protein
MAHPWHHAERSARLFGGVPDDYLAIHNWFDESKAHLPDVRHRALRHHSEGIFLCETLFGTTIKNSAGRVIPVRQIGEQHVKDDLGWIPTVKDWLVHLPLQPWMTGNSVQRRSVEIPALKGSLNGPDSTAQAGAALGPGL